MHDVGYDGENRTFGIRVMNDRFVVEVDKKMTFPAGNGTALITSAIGVYDLTKNAPANMVH